ncbi:MAG: hypothetical protein ACD_2C00073G0034 [uncultured bacterium (gcode 4)]|uniref:Uncharacterized protein n=1 Tax=uncultured bacterium (gcode 4) TaxID=1234023 RepID=K2FFG8_9BACT|nr:MAG: hypothetical protein ACD_2C00073G0034 [uncultured bacterium (gcode 4)]
MRHTLNGIVSKKLKISRTAFLRANINRRLLWVINRRRIKEWKTILTGMMYEHSLRASKILTYFAWN